jgi:hypothetical protein
LSQQLVQQFLVRPSITHHLPVRHPSTLFYTPTITVFFYDIDNDGDGDDDDDGNVGLVHFSLYR